MVNNEKNALKVLHLEDSEEDSKLILNHLKLLGHVIHHQRVSLKSEFENALSLQSWSFVISDYHLRYFTTVEALAMVRQKYPDLSFILVSERIGEEIVADMIKAGVEDFVMKSRLERLTPVIKRMLRESEIKDKEVRARSIVNKAYAAKEQMLAIVSHDIKNPLSAIQLEAQMLLRIADRNGKTLLAEEVKIQANRILKTTDRLKVLISDLLDKNKSEEGLSSLTKTEISPVKLFQEAIDASRPLIQQKEILIKTTFLSKTDILFLDKNKMFQVLSNLLNNAIKFTPVRGTIQLGLEENDHEFIFSVIDNGPGLNQMDLDRVFEKYWTGSISGCSGTGLGLFICKIIVEAHAGRICVENVEEKGARFWFSLPKPRTNVELPPQSVFEVLKKDTRKKILVVDDDEDLREVISWALGKEGFNVTSYRNPVEALNHLREGRSFPQLIIIDFHMEGMKGSEFLKNKNLISNREIQNCPVVMISASPQEVQTEVPSALYKEILAKPIDLEGLVEKIRKHIL